STPASSTFPRVSTVRRCCSAGASAKSRLHTGTAWKKVSQDASSSIPNRTTAHAQLAPTPDRGRRRDGDARLREARRQGTEPARAGAGGGDAVPHDQARRDD